VHFDDANDVAAQLRALYASRLGHPAFLRYQGRPVIFFWRSGLYDNATWSSIRAQVDPEHRALWIADGGNRAEFAIVAGDAWDGISPYTIAWAPNPATQLPAWASQVRSITSDKLWIPPISPGCNDVNAALQGREPCDRGRSGAYYSAAFSGAVASRPEWAIMVSTFNEWIEGTQIEPSVPDDYGEECLELTREFAARFKGGE
jgi:hypothetical protein